jgi:hypothetical protein
MAIDTLGANALASNSVTTAKIAADAVTSAKIPAGAVVASDVADGSVTTAKLAAGAVTTAKVADDAVTGAKLYAENLGRRNLIINGAMQVAQRATSQASISSAGYYVQDRFKVNTNDAGVWTQTQESLTTSDTPFQNGFTQALKLDCTTASASLNAAGTLQINQAIEGYNVQRLGSGSSSAKSITVSFWIKATKTGTNVLASYQDDGGKQVATTYTINVSNTWEFKTVTLPANTSDVIVNDNTRGRLVTWYFAAGSNRTSGTLRNTWTAYATADEAVGQVNHADNVANNIHITGIQVEVGDTATPFEHRSYGEELQLCQRYFYPVCPKNISGQSIGMAYYYVGTTLLGIVHFPVTMRTAPTITGADVSNYFTTTHNDLMNYLLANRVTTTTLEFYNNSQVSGTAMQAVIARSNNANAFIYATAEL